jgi:hypothetical protein
MPRTRTYNAGANAERTAILAHVRRARPRDERLIAWLLSRDLRYNKKDRGVGK